MLEGDNVSVINAIGQGENIYGLTSTAGIVANIRLPFSFVKREMLSSMCWLSLLGPFLIIFFF